MVAAISVVAPQRLPGAWTSLSGTAGVCSLRAPEILLLDHCALSLETTQPPMASEMMLLNRHARTPKRASGGYDSLPCSSHDRPVLRNELILDIAGLL